MNSAYIIDNEAVIKRFERDFFNGRITNAEIDRIVVYEGVLPKELAKSFDLDKSKQFINYIQEKEAVFFSKKDRSLIVSCHSGLSRVKHFSAQTSRYSQTTGRKIEFETRVVGDYQRLATEWVCRIGERLPAHIIIGSARGISALMYGYEFEAPEFKTYFQKRIATYSSAEYLKNMNLSPDEKLQEEVRLDLLADALFLNDSRLLWGISSLRESFLNGFGQGAEYHLDEYLDFAFVKIGRRTFLNIHYPYGDHLQTVLHSIQKNKKLEQVYYIGSCGILDPKGTINDIVLPQALSYNDETIKIKNKLAKDSMDASFQRPIQHRIFEGKSKIVDTPIDETVGQLEDFRNEGFDCVDTEAFHIAKAISPSTEVGIVYYASDAPLKGHTLANMPPSYLGWRLAVQSLIRELKA